MAPVGKIAEEGKGDKTQTRILSHLLTVLIRIVESFSLLIFRSQWKNMSVDWTSIIDILPSFS